jgi:hypothetical protein
MEHRIGDYTFRRNIETICQKDWHSLYWSYRNLFNAVRGILRSRTTNKHLSVIKQLPPEDFSVINFNVRLLHLSTFDFSYYSTKSSQPEGIHSVVS